jgi:PAS domain S-box-containing protein
MANHLSDSPPDPDPTGLLTGQGAGLHPSVLSAPVEQMQALIEYCPAAIALLDRDLRYLLVSQKWREDFGVGDRDLRGISHYDLFPEAVRWQGIYQQCLAGAIEHGGEDSLTRADGTTDWLRWEVRPWYTSAGETGGLVMFTELMTQRRLAEQSLPQTIANLEQQVAEAALRESEARHRALLEAIPDLLFRYNRQGVHLDFFPSREWDTVVEPELFLGKPLDQVLPVDVAQQIVAAINAALDTGTLQLIEYQLELDGKINDYEARIVTSGDNEVTTIVRNISEQKASERDRKAAEMELQETRHFLESVLENLPVSVFAKDAQDLRFILWNTAAQELLGYTADEVIGNYDADLFPAEQARNFVAQDRQAINSGMVIEIPEEPIQTATGETRILKTTKTTILDSEGNPQYVLAIAEDITERKQAEAQLREKEQFLRTIYDGVECCIFVIDVLENNEFRYVSYNQYAEQITGLSSADVAGKTPEERFGIVEGTKLRQTLARCVEMGTALTEEECLRFGDRQIWFLTTFNPLRDENGRIYRIVATSSDITQLKQAETQLKQQAADLEETLQELQHTQEQMLQSEKMSSLGQLVAGVAHEINNPVNFIFGNLNHANAYTQDLLKLLGLYQQYYPDPHPDVQAEAEAIDLDFLVEDLPKLLNSMRVGADRIQKIVASLRTFSRMDEAEMKAVDIHEGIDSTLMILQNRLKAKDSRPAIEVVKHYDNLPLVECYAGQLNQVFMNILSNAIDALEEHLESGRVPSDVQDAPTADPNSVIANIQNPPTITISTWRVDSNQVKIAIADNGPGIPPEVRRRLFDPFFTTKPVGKGTGMGLSISYQIITEKHGGSLFCQSEPGQGAQFIIQIPLKQS